MGILIAIVIFCIIVIFHEFGHFICAKLSGISVLEFSVGMGPKLFQFKKGETKYSLRLLPIGGYCAMEGEDETDDNPRSFRNAALWKRMIVLAAGAFMNFVLGFILLLGLNGMSESVLNTKIDGFRLFKNAETGEIESGATSNNFLKEGDQFIEINDTRIFSYLDLSFIFSTAKSNKLDVVVKRDGEKIEFKDVTFLDITDNSMIDFTLEHHDKTPGNVIKSSGEMFMSMTHIVGLSIKQMLSGKADKEEVSGPVGVVTAINDTTKESEDTKDAIYNLLYMAALITINLGIVNLLPLPALDGGRLLFCLIELVRRKPVKPEHEGYVHLVGMLLLFGLMIFATYNDIARIISGG